MRVLVTGGAGFLGSHLCDALVARGDEVRVLDDESSGTAAQLQEGVTFLRGDIRDPAVVTRAVADMDLVFHLAAAVGPALVAGDPVGTWSRNVIGTAYVLDACAQTGARVLIASSSEVYDAVVDSGPLREDQPLPVDPLGRRDVYAVSKLAGECYAQALHRSKLLPVTIVRPFSIVGPRQSARYGMVLARFVDAALRGVPLPIYGDGAQARCFLHVHDAVEALLALVPVAAAEGAVVNLGSDRPVTIRALADRVLALSGATSGTVQVPFANVYGEGFVDPPCRQPDLTRLEALTSWQPTRGVDAMIEDALMVARGDAPTLRAGRDVP